MLENKRPIVQSELTKDGMFERVRDANRCWISRACEIASRASTSCFEPHQRFIGNGIMSISR